MERRTLEAVIYEREPPIARIILNRPDKANTKDATLVQEVDACLHEADRDREIKVVILKANGNGFCGGHVARWGPEENPSRFRRHVEDLYKGTADLFPGRRCICGNFRNRPSPRFTATAWAVGSISAC